MVILNPYGRSFWLPAIGLYAIPGAVVWAQVRARVSRMRSLPLWLAMTSIIYKPAVSAAAKNSF
jgi:hypothetical protein